MRWGAARSKLGKKAIRSKLGTSAVMSAVPMAANAHHDAPKVALGTNALETAPAITPAREKS